MSEYISKDDAKLLIDFLNKETYNLKDARVYISIMDRLQQYIDNPDNLQIKMVNGDKAEVVKK